MSDPTIPQKPPFGKIRQVIELTETYEDHAAKALTWHLQTMSRLTDDRLCRKETQNYHIARCAWLTYYHYKIAQLRRDYEADNA